MRISDFRADEVKESYKYLLTRYLVLRQEIRDTKGIPYNEIHHKKIDLNDITFVNPNFDVVYSEAWVAIDETHSVTINVPRIEGRYYTVQVLNGWGETIANINERTYAKKPYGKFSFILKGTLPPIASDSTVIEILDRKVKLLIRVEIQGDMDRAVELQQQFTLDVASGIEIEPPFFVEDFTNEHLLGVEVFENVQEVLATYMDTLPDAEEYQSTALVLNNIINESAVEKEALNDLIKKTIIPAFFKETQEFRQVVGGWLSGYVDPTTIDNTLRVVINYIGIWANVGSEVVYYVSFADSEGVSLNGDSTYQIKFIKGELPDELASAYWSLTALSIPDYLILPNKLGKYSINNMDDVSYDQDGGLTLWLSKELPHGVRKGNWLPLVAGKPFNLNFRLYVPVKKVLSADYFLPPLNKEKSF